MKHPAPRPSFDRESEMPIRLPLTALLAVVWVCSAISAEPTLPEVAATDWPWWRGPTLDGKSRDTSAPTRWSATDNVVWNVPVPGKGHSSPVLWGDRIYLTTADEAE